MSDKFKCFDSMFIDLGQQIQDIRLSQNMNAELKIYVVRKKKTHC